MKLIKVFLLGLIGIILPVSLSAQTVSGKLIDENSQPLPYANVVLLSLPDSAFVSGTISGEDGSFIWIYTRFCYCVHNPKAYRGFYA
jgi:hypothetical protein